MQPKCQVCGKFISEADLWDTYSIECCEKHGDIKICAACLELFEKTITPEIAERTCIIEWVRMYKKTLTPDTYPQYACPNCDYQSHSFEAAANHMAAKNHLYNGIGTYPIFVQGPETDPKKIGTLQSMLNREAIARNSQQLRKDQNE